MTGWEIFALGAIIHAVFWLAWWVWAFLTDTVDHFIVGVLLWHVFFLGLAVVSGFLAILAGMWSPF